MPRRIDVHSHMLPGIDDGCEDIEQSLESIARLQAYGYVGSVCTPHIWPELFPGNTPSHIQGLTIQLQRELEARDIDYRLWPGGELRLFKGAIKWLQQHGVPTLAGTRYVLCDLWEDRWPRHADQTLDYLLEEGYTPILAHPERMNLDGKLPTQLDRLAERSVLLQGNFNCFTGVEGPLAAERVRRFLHEDRYSLMAMDMHRPEVLDTRIEGLEIMAEEFGVAEVDRLTDQAPRRLLGLDEAS
jgi:protein-tyrosine phosphatase